MTAQMRAMQNKLELLEEKLAPPPKTSTHEMGGPPAQSPLPVFSSSSQHQSPPDRRPSLMTDTVEEASSYRGQSSSEFTLGLAKHNLQTMGIVPSRTDSTSTFVDRAIELGGGLGAATKICLKDPLREIQRDKALRLLESYERGPGSMYPILDLDRASSEIASLFDLLEPIKDRKVVEKILLAAEALTSQSANILKITLAIAFSLQKGGRDKRGENLLQSVQDSWESPFGGQVNLKSITLLVLLVRRAQKYHRRRPVADSHSGLK